MQAAGLEVLIAQQGFWPTPSLSMERVQTQLPDPSYAGAQQVLTLRLQQALWTGGRLTAQSIEYIDLKKDVYSNQLTIRVDDVLDMAGSNWINDTLSGINGEGGWRNAGSSTTMSSSTWQYHQIVIDGTSQDTVSTTGWTLLTTGMLNGWQTRDNLFHPYDVYIATDGRPAMMMVEQPIVRSTVL